MPARSIESKEGNRSRIDECGHTFPEFHVKHPELDLRLCGFEFTEPAHPMGGLEESAVPLGLTRIVPL